MVHYVYSLANSDYYSIVMLLLLIVYLFTGVISNLTVIFVSN
jgi:hypothetical protein